MRARFNNKAKDEIIACDKFVKDSALLKEIIQKNKDKKIFVEIGMGKGDFISNLSSMDRENIYIGIELCISVLALAIKKNY